MPQLSIRTKLLVAVVVVLGLSGAASALLVNRLYQGAVDRASEEAVRGAAAAYADLERQDTEKLAAIVDAATASPALREAFATRDRERLQAIALPIQKTLKADHVIEHMNFIEGDTHRMFLRVHLPDKFGDVVQRPALLKAMERMETSTGKDLGKSAFALRVGRPVMQDGKLVGYMELGEVIDGFLGKMKAQTGNDYAMFIYKKLIDAGEWARTRGNQRNGWDDLADVVVVNSTTPEPMVDEVAASHAAEPKGRVLEELQHGEQLFVRGVVPVRDASGNVVGGLAVRHDITALHAGMRTGMLHALLVVIALAVLACAAVAVLADRLIFRRLKGMTAQLRDLSTRLAGGDYSVAQAVKAVSDDEIGKFERFFGDFLKLVANTLRALAERGSRAAARPAAPPALPPSPVGKVPAA